MTTNAPDIAQLHLIWAIIKRAPAGDGHDTMYSHSPGLSEALLMTRPAGAMLAGEPSTEKNMQRSNIYTPSL